MPVTINNQTYYRTAEVCRIVGISRATLFRWLKAGILKGDEHRDRRGWRLFGKENLKKLQAEAGKVITSGREQSVKPMQKMPHILVVDDEPVIGELFKDVLREQPVKVTTVTDSRVARELCSSERFDLIFLDLKMPRINGPALLRHTLQLDPMAQVVIITGYPHSDLMAQAMEYGHFLVMKKPFNGEDIRRVVSQIASSQ